MRETLLYIAITLFSSLSSVAFAREDGSREHPYTVSSAQDLIALQKAINEGVAYHSAELPDGAEGMYFDVTQDIDLRKNETIVKKGWKPIGTESSPFKGKFCGHSFKISYKDKKAKDSTPFILFGHTKNSTIKDLFIDTWYSESANINYVCANGENTKIYNCAITDTMPSAITEYAHSTYSLYGLNQVKKRGYENGSYEHPFVITDENDFIQFSKAINGGSPYHNSEIELGGEGSHFILGADIDMKKLASQGITKWQPIGVPSMPFKGHFSGNGHKILNLSLISDKASFVGLFGYTDGAMIENVHIVNATIRANFNAGLLIGYAANTDVKNCTVSGTLSGNKWLGAICGETFNSRIGGCETKCDISAGHNSYSIGGIVGEATSRSTLYQCIAKGSILGATCVGDIYGILEDSNVYLCTETKIAVETGDYIAIDLASILFRR